MTMPTLVTPDYAPLDPTAKRLLTHALRADAAEAHSPYPQYNGKFDNWTLYVITDTEAIRFKSGASLPSGRLVLADPELSIHEGCPVTRGAYDPSTQHVLGVPHEHIRRL